MTQRSHVPQFGNWESGDNVPYTVFFDKARKGRGGKMVNPNDPQENPGMFHDDASSHAPAAIPRVKSEPEELIGQGAVRPAHERRRSREDGELRPYANSSVRPDNQNRRAPNESGQPRYGGGRGGEPQRRPARPSAGSEHSVERSPLHPQARISGKGSGGFPSPSREAKNSYDSSHGTPGRSRLRPTTQGDDPHDNSAAVPKFGGWDESDPSSAEGYTGIFNKVREERHNGAANTRAAGMNDPYMKVTKPAPTSTKTGCFAWFRK